MYAELQKDLGKTYSWFSTEDHLKRAIAYYEQALRFYTPENNMKRIYDLQMDIASAYCQLPIDAQAKNLTQAITCYEQALHVLTSEIDAWIPAHIYDCLGDVYSALPLGGRAENQMRAIECYKQALALDVDPHYQYDLGNAYRDLETGDRSENLRQAIYYYQQALTTWTPQNEPHDYAKVQNHLGEAYRNLPTGDRAEDLKRAIACYQQALYIRTAENDPLGYATLQNNLGAAFASLPTGDRTANIELAIGCYEQALRFWTAENAAHSYAGVKSNLSDAYRIRLTGDHDANTARAIEYGEEALRIRTPENDPQGYALSSVNLGNIYAQLRVGDWDSNQTKAIECYEEALRFLTPVVNPLEYALVQSNLGLLYHYLETGDQANNQAQAIAYFEMALRIQTPANAPLDYAHTQNNLGLVCREQNNQAQAIACFQQALLYTPETEAFASRRIANNLAELYFVQGMWEEALQTYRTAIHAGEQLYRASLSTESKAVESLENADFYSQAAFAAVRCGEVEEALLILERGKTRLLTEGLRLRVHRPAHVPEDVWETFEQARAIMHAQQTKKTFMDLEMRDPVQAYKAQIHAAEAANMAFEHALKQIQLYVPHFLAPIDLATIQAQVSDKETALLAFCVTAQGSVGFVVSQCDQQMVQAIDVPDFTEADLQHIFMRTDPDNYGWLAGFRTHEIALWQKTIEQVLAELGEHLLTPLVSALPAGIKRLILLPAAELFLFPLHAIPLFDDGGGLLCDRYQIRYAPSIEVLAEARTSVRKDIQPELYAVINPDPKHNLIFAPFEGDAIVRLFAQGHSRIDLGRAGTKERVLSRMRKRTYLHFACHGNYNWQNPPASGLHLADGDLMLADLQRGGIDLSAARLVILSGLRNGHHRYLAEQSSGICRHSSGLSAFWSPLCDQ